MLLLGLGVPGLPGPVGGWRVILIWGLSDGDELYAERLDAQA